MSNPFISICIPAYKNVDYLQRLLKSIAIQNYRDYEVIITDDNPTDEIKALLNKFPELTISYFKNQPTQGMPGNWNAAIKKAKGKWIKMMHDDDWFASSASLQKFADKALKTPKKFIFSASNNISSISDKEINEFLTTNKRDMLDEDPLNLFYSNVIGHPSTVMHKKDDTILYDTQFKWVVDIDFYIRYLLKYVGYEYIPEMLINIGVGEHQLSNKYYKNPKVEIPEYFRMLNKYPVKLSDNKYVFHAFWLLVRKFKLRNSDEIKSAGYTGFIPDEIAVIIKCQKNIPRIILKQTPFSNYFMEKCYSEIHQGLYR